jgi:hypothetical protein
MIIMWSYLTVILKHVHHVISSLLHTWYWFYAYACNRCARWCDPTGIQGNGLGGSAAPVTGATGVGTRRCARRCQGWLSISHALQLCERQAPEHYKPPNFWNQLSIYVIHIDALSYRCWLKTLAARTDQIIITQVQKQSPEWSNPYTYAPITPVVREITKNFK